MSEMNQTFIAVDAAINGYLDRSEQGNHKFFKCWHIAMDGLDNLGLDFFYTVKSVKLPVNANKTVTLPPDFRKWSKVGVFNELGEVITLFYNEKLTTYADLNPNRAIKTEDNRLFNGFVFNSPIFYNFWNGYLFSNIYGVPSGSPFIGTFKVDIQNAVILLSEFFIYPYIVLEYIAHPELGQTYYFPSEFKEAEIWYIAWHDVAFVPPSRRANMGSVADRRHNYFNERRLARARWRPFLWEEAYEWNLRNQRKVPKA